EYAIVTQFGRVVATNTEPGLHFKIPFIQTVTRIDRRLREWDGEPSDLLTIDKENIEVNTWARWRVTDPRQFYEALRTESAGQGVLDGLVDASVKNVISGQTLMEALRSTPRRLKYSDPELEAAEASKSITVSMGREKIVDEVLVQAARQTDVEYGFSITGLEIKSFNYVRPVIPKIYERMRSERIRIANRYESEGREREAKILGQVAKDLEEITSQGYREATRIRGEADAQVLKVYAEAYGKDADFYSFSRSLEILPEAFGKGTQLVLDAENNELLRHMKTHGAAAPGKPGHPKLVPSKR
ncbi:MAG: protease modulator HflC, partial [Myxococcota bacterium]|nr:protease modulator HflC [Myxococcota bacterium]